MKNREEIGDILHDFLLCVIFGAGTAMGVAVVVSITQILWNL